MTPEEVDKLAEEDIDTLVSMVTASLRADDSLEPREFIESTPSSLTRLVTRWQLQATKAALERRDVGTAPVDNGFATKVPDTLPETLKRANPMDASHDSDLGFRKSKILRVAGVPTGEQDEEVPDFRSGLGGPAFIRPSQLKTYPGKTTVLLNAHTPFFFSRGNKHRVWGTEHEKAFRSLQDSIRSAVYMAFPKKGKRICIYTDASDRFWSAVITQTDPEDLRKPISQQSHEPLAFLGAAFTDTEQRWSTFEQEGFAIYQAFKRVDYLFYSDEPAHVFTDHRNLLFVFAPAAFEPALGRHVVNKVQRWALYLSQFNYVIEHVSGENNVFADILTRWLKGYRSDRCSARKMCKLTRLHSIVDSPAKENYIWPSMSAFRSAQELHPPNATLTEIVTWDEEDKLWKKDDCIWIPSECLDVQLKVLVVSHCSLGGHRGIDATESIVREHFHWTNLKDDVATFVRSCIHCIITRTGEMMPRPLGTALHGKRPNEVVHIDYLYMGQGIDGLKYLLLIRDDLSSLIWLGATAAPTGAYAAQLLAKWVSMFGTMDWLVSDQGSYFHNKVHSDLIRKFRTRKHFTTAYSPWANGTIERINREVIRTCKALRSEWKFAEQDWPAVVDCAQSVINHAPLKRLGYPKPGVFRTTLEVFTGITPTRPLLCSLAVQKYKHAQTDDEIKIRQLIEIDRIQSSLEVMHKEVAERVDANRAKGILKHNAKNNVLPANFSIGDFVLVRKAQPNKGRKLQFLWRGPKRIVAVKSKWVFEVEGLIDKKREIVHARRLIWYRCDRENKDIDPAILEYATHSETDYETISQLLDVKKEKDTFLILVQWQGLPDKVDRT